MTWNSPADVLFMDGYGLYVWGSYGLAIVLALVEPLLARRRHRAALDAIGQADQGGAP